MRFGVSSYSFSQKINAGEMTQLDTVRAAKELGFDCIEFTEIKPHDDSTQLEYAAKIREEAKKVGICVNCYTIAAHFAVDTEEELFTEVERMKGQVDVAEALGVTLMRQDSMRGLGSYRSFDQMLPMLAKGVRAVCEYAETKGIRTMVENHGFVAQDSDRVERLFNAVNHKNFGILVDMGNFACVDEDSVSAVSRLAPYAFHAHAKDFIKIPFDKITPATLGILTRGCNMLKGCTIGHGVIPVKQCIKILDRAGYTGDLSIEYEGAADCIQGISEGLANLKTYVKELNLE